MSARRCALPIRAGQGLLAVAPKGAPTSMYILPLVGVLLVAILGTLSSRPLHSVISQPAAGTPRSSFGRVLAQSGEEVIDEIYANDTDSLYQLRASLDWEGVLGLNWNDSDPCQWRFVECNADGYVTKIEIAGTGADQIGGTLPTWVGPRSVLPRLRELVIDGTNISGSLPAEWGHSWKLAEVRRIEITRNYYMDGSLPISWGYQHTFPRLQALLLTDTAVQGTLPGEWGQGFKQLRRLDLSCNRECSKHTPLYIEGKLPGEWGLPNAFPQLEQLWLQGWNNSRQLRDKIPIGWQQTNVRALESQPFQKLRSLYIYPGNSGLCGSFSVGGDYLNPENLTLSAWMQDLEQPLPVSLEAGGLSWPTSPWLPKASSLPLAYDTVYGLEDDTSESSHTWTLRSACSNVTLQGDGFQGRVLLDLEWNAEGLSEDLQQQGLLEPVPTGASARLHLALRTAIKSTIKTQIEFVPLVSLVYMNNTVVSRHAASHSRRHLRRLMQAGPTPGPESDAQRMVVVRSRARVSVYSTRLLTVKMLQWVMDDPTDLESELAQAFLQEALPEINITVLCVQQQGLENNTAAWPPLDQFIDACPDELVPKPPAPTPTPTTLQPTQLPDEPQPSGAEAFGESGFIPISDGSGSDSSATILTVIFVTAGLFMVLALLVLWRCWRRSAAADAEAALGKAYSVTTNAETPSAFLGAEPRGSDPMAAQDLHTPHRLSPPGVVVGEKDRIPESAFYFVKTVDVQDGSHSADHDKDPSHPWAELSAASEAAPLRTNFPRPGSAAVLKPQSSAAGAAAGKAAHMRSGSDGLVLDDLHLLTQESAPAEWPPLSRCSRAAAPLQGASSEPLHASQPCHTGTPSTATASTHHETHRHHGTLPHRPQRQSRMGRAFPVAQPAQGMSSMLRAASAEVGGSADASQLLAGYPPQAVVLLRAAAPPDPEPSSGSSGQFSTMAPLVDGMPQQDGTHGLSPWRAPSQLTVGAAPPPPQFKSLQQQLMEAQRAACAASCGPRGAEAEAGLECSTSRVWGVREASEPASREASGADLKHERSGGGGGGGGKGGGGGEGDAGAGAHAWSPRRSSQELPRAWSGREWGEDGDRASSGAAGPSRHVGHWGGSVASGPRRLRSDKLDLVARLLPQLPDADLDVDPASIKFIRRLGAGAFAQVYEGLWTACDGVVRRVAVKVVNTSAVEHGLREWQHYMRMFHTELDIMTRIDHPNVVRCYGGCVRRDCSMLLLEFMQGGTLSRYCHTVREHNPMSCLEVALVGSHVASALAFLHPLVVHCDIKPQNILLDVNGVAKLTDFGLSKYMLESVMSSRVGGTPAYTAPEVFQSKEVSEKADIYSLAMVMWECFSGKQPWSDLDYPVQIFYHVHQLKQRPQIPESWPPNFAKLMRRSWDSNPWLRPGAGELARKLQLMLVAETASTARSMSLSTPTHSGHND